MQNIVSSMPQWFNQAMVYLHQHRLRYSWFWLKFKDKFWREENLAVKRKLRYHKEVINPNLEDQKYLSVVTNSQKKINIAKIKKNSHELHNETRRWSILKNLWAERVFHLYESLSIEDGNQFLLKCPAYTHIRTKFHSICYNTSLSSLLLTKTIMISESFTPSFLSKGTQF